MKWIWNTLLVAATLGSVGAAAPHPSLPSSVVPDGLGVNIHFTDARPGELELLAAAGFHWVRMDFSWSATEKRHGEYDFSGYDRLLASLEKNHLRALFILDYGNSLYETNRSVATESGRQAFAKWAAAVAVHFKNHGILWEIWNEPNGSFWEPKANVDEYAALALTTSKAIHRAAPGEALIGPATSGVDFKFLEACFKAGLLEYWDAVSVHPYRQSGPETAAEDYRKLRRLIERYTSPGKAIPILSGEWGYSSAWKNFDETKQGQMLARQWLVNLANDIPLSIWYDWHDDGTDPKEGEHHFGTVANPYHADAPQVFDPKPTYLAARTFTSVLNGFQFSKRLALGRAEDFGLLFKNGNELRLAIWTTASVAKPIEIPSDLGQFEMISHTGEKLPSLPVAHGRLKIIPTASPIYLICQRPNLKLAATPAAHPLRASLGLVGTNAFAVQIENLCDLPFHGKLQLLLPGRSHGATVDRRLDLNPSESSAPLSFTFEPSNESGLTAGLRVMSEDTVIYEMPVRKFNPIDTATLLAGRIVGDGDAKVSSQQTITVATPPEVLLLQSNLPVAKLTYQCAIGWKFFRVIPPEGKAREIVGKPVGFGIWIYGAQNQVSPRLRLIDATGQTLQPSAETIDWGGWRYVEFDFTAPAGHWGGADDGQFHYPIRWDTLLLLDNVSRQPTAGAVYLAAPTLIYN